jgi:hypothetical protein
MIVVNSRSLDHNVADKVTRPLGTLATMADVTECRLSDMITESLPGWAKDSIMIDMRQISATQWVSICHDKGACMHVSLIEVTQVLHYV